MWIVFVAIISIYTGQILSLCNNCKPSYCDPGGKCRNCNDGFYIFSNTGLCYTCPANCTICTSVQSCKTCKVGNHGINCWRPCSEGCEKRDCEKTYGRCKDGCIKGYYGSTCRSKCSEGCSNQTCDEKNGRCTDGCIDGYYGQTCLRCPTSCATCTTRYSCQTCKVGYYGTACRTSCSKGCKDWACDKADGHCICIKGFYGGSCRTKCLEGCFNQTCDQDDGRCTDGCIKGYYGDYCIKCSRGCLNQTCDQDYGWCPGGCISGYYGDKCMPCPGNCATCITQYPCTSCKTGFFDKYCNKGCVNCRNNTCSCEKGTCDLGCIDGYFYKDGIGCQACSDNCSKCTTGLVCDQCKPGFYVSNGGHANKNGSCVSCQKCKDPTTCFSKNVCPDCRDGSWGQYCQLSCSKNCLEVLNTTFTCWQHNLTCKEGCKQGFTGADCIEEISDSSTLLMIVGSSVGAVAVAVAIVLTVIILTRKNRSTTRIMSRGGKPTMKKSIRTDTLNPAYEDMTIYPTLGSNAGHHPAPRGTETSGDNVYANVQKPSRGPGQLGQSRRADSDSDHVYDVTWNSATSVKQADQSQSQAEGDTYSHINHASHNTEHRHDDEETYDHVTRQNPHRVDIDDTYDVTGGQASSGHAPTDEYSTVLRVQEGIHA